MARHNPGDRPTHNVRTAPTPTTEEPSYIPGVSQSSQSGHESQSLPGQSPADQGQIPGGQLHRNQEESGTRGLKYLTRSLYTGVLL